MSELASVYRINGDLSMMGVFQHKWQGKGKDSFEVGACWTPF